MLVLTLRVLGSNAMVMHFVLAMIVCADERILCFIVTCGGSFVKLVNDHPSEEELIQDRIRAGTVQMCLNGEFHTLCSDNWDNKDASVLCRGIGFSQYGEFYDTHIIQLNFLIVV